MEFIWICFIIFVLGACIGSFLNVAALRAITNESIVFPSSKCPKCGNKIKWYDNIPIFSYFFTFKGKCRNCNCKVSKQYPIVEALTAFLFLITFLAFGVTIKTLLFLILFSISIVIMITDIKEECIFEVHAWILIISAIIASLYINGIQNYTIPVFGIISGILAMELIARFSYVLVRKNHQHEQDEEKSEIYEYIDNNKRTFGEGDTYIIAASGALLGWKYVLFALFLAVVFQAVCILPQFTINLFKNKQYKLVFSLTGFLITAIVYYILTNTIQLNIFLIIALMAVLILFAIDSIIRLRENINKQEFLAIPFGPAILISTYFVLFFGKNILNFII